MTGGMGAKRIARSYDALWKGYAETRMERLTSRKNPIIAHMRALGANRDYRCAHGEFLCDGEKLLREAVLWKAEITSILWTEEPDEPAPCAKQYLVPKELLDYVSPLKSAASVLFSVRMRRWECLPGRTLVLESIQDPGNLGTILRTANALGMDSVILIGACADLWNPKTVRAGMGAVFRQPCAEMEPETLRSWLTENGMKLYGAALSDQSADIRTLDLARSAVAIGSEGQGLSEGFRALCDGELIIPMREACESLNAAIAAAIVMWELAKTDEGLQK